MSHAPPSCLLLFVAFVVVAVVVAFAVAVVGLFITRIPLIFMDFCNKLLYCNFLCAFLFVEDEGAEEDEQNHRQGVSLCKLLQTFTVLDSE